MPNISFSHVPIEVPRVNTEFRTIVTKIPVPESIPLFERLYATESRSMHGQLPIIWDRADDFQVYDQWGNKWLDFTSTIFVANAGHSNPLVRNAITRTLNKPLLHTYTYPSNERIEYLSYLIDNTPSQFEKAFLVSSGTEATEAALKLMRLHGLTQNESRVGILSFQGAFHGRTMGAQMMSGNFSGHKWINCQDPQIFYLDFPYPWLPEVKNPKDFFLQNIETLLEKNHLDPSRDICGIMLESFQGWGAVFYPNEFIQMLVEFAQSNGILVCIDEIQSGFGRTGTLFGYMHYAIEPDLICCGKGASSGLPLALVLGPSQIMDLPSIGSMSSTNSANPLACVAGHSSLKEILEGGLLNNSKVLGHVFHDHLTRLKTKHSKVLKYSLGEGLLAGLIFLDNDNQPLTKLCNLICEKAMQKGLLLIHTGRESIKLAPPLTITEDALAEGLEVLDCCIDEAVKDIL